MAGTRTGRDEDALSEIVGFVLVLALVVVASTLYLMYVVPAEGREDEITHMNKVQDRFVSYKTSVDGLWLRSLGDLSVSGTRGVSLSTSFDLGTGGGNTQSSGLFLSFMKPIGTAAKMRVTGSQQVDTLTLTVDGAPLAGFTNVGLGQLSYETSNHYWIQQRYEYSAGGVFLEQRGEGVSVKVAPLLSTYMVRNTTTVGVDRPAVKMNLCLVNPTGPEALIGGTGPLRVETRLRENFDSRTPDEQHDSITVMVVARDEHWAAAWEQIFNDVARRGGLDDDLYDVTRESNKVYFDVYDPDTDLDDTTHDLYFTLNRANLQVTFEYAEP